MRVPGPRPQSAERTEIHDSPAIARQHSPGSLLGAGKRVEVVCGDGRALELIEVQLEGKKRIAAAAFANGQRLQDNESFGESI